MTVAPPVFTPAQLREMITAEILRFYDDGIYDLRWRIVVPPSWQDVTIEALTGVSLERLEVAHLAITPPDPTEVFGESEGLTFEVYVEPTAVAMFVIPESSMTTVD